MKKNLELWEAVEETNPEITKNAKLGSLNITAINATSQIKKATEHWGSYGDNWGLKDLDYSYMDVGETKLALVKSKFYYPKGEFELSSCIKVCYRTNGTNSYLKIDDDFMKKIETDLTTKALAKLGFNADVFMGLYDDNKYVESMKKKFAPVIELITKEQVLELVKLISEAKTTMKALLTTLNWGIVKLEEIQKASFESVVSLLKGKITRNIAREVA